MDSECTVTVMVLVLVTVLVWKVQRRYLVKKVITLLAQKVELVKFLVVVVYIFT